MYAAEIDGKAYTFEASGSLWKDALVMMDRQTKSLWSQISGEVLDGSMMGTTLELIPSEFMNFSAVVEKYPRAKFLKKESKGKRSSYYHRTGYFSDPDKIGIFGHTFESEEMGTKSIALGLRLGRDAVALPIEDVKKPAAAKVELMDKVALVFYDPESKDGFAYSIDAEGAKKGKLSVEIDGSVKFSGKTYSAADFRNGAEGIEAFEPMPLITTFWFAWKSFFPRTTVGRFWPNG